MELVEKEKAVLMSKEERETGAVGIKVYMTWANAAGEWIGPTSLLIFHIYRILYLFSTLYLLFSYTYHSLTRLKMLFTLVITLLVYKVLFSGPSLVITLLIVLLSNVARIGVDYWTTVWTERQIPSWTDDTYYIGNWVAVHVLRRPIFSDSLLSV